jgi:signal transduction histidine kinase
MSSARPEEALSRMSAELHVGPPAAAGAPAGPALRALARVHPLVALTDARGRVLWVSDATLAAGARLCAHSIDLVGRELPDCIPLLAHPEQAREALAAIRTRGRVLRAPLAVSDQSGREQLFELTVFPLPGSDPAPAFAAVARHVEPARAAPARHPLLESAADALLAVDAEGFVTQANPAALRLLGLSRDELEGAPLSVLAADEEGLVSLLSALPPAEAGAVELALRGASDDPLAIAASIAPLQGEAGGAAVSLREVGSWRDAHAQLARRHEELEHCVNTLAHDLRSPLVALLGFSRLLRQDYGERLDQTGAHFVDRIEQAGRTMEALIHDLLELSRIGQPGLRPTLVDPRSVLLQLAAELKPRLEQLEMRLVLPDDPPLVYCDRTRLYQLFSNLIGNALEHMGECADRRIVVEVVEEGAHHRISVRDFGRGIDPDQHERIFQPFYTLGRRGAGRTGMGLAIVRKIAETHAGRAWVESRPGEGAAFHVTLPVPGPA